MKQNEKEIDVKNVFMKAWTLKEIKMECGIHLFREIISVENAQCVKRN